MNWGESEYSGLQDIIKSYTTYILNAAKNCEPEVRNFLNGIFASALNKDDSALPTDLKSISESDTARALILGKLIDHLKKLEPIHIDCYELDGHSIGHERMNKR